MASDNPTLSWKSEDDDSSRPLLFLADDDGSDDTKPQQQNKDEGDDQSRKVLLKNLAFDITSKNLEDFCSACGPLQNAFVVMDKSGQRSRGFGYAQYATREGALAALTELNGQELNGRRVVIQKPRERSEKQKQQKKQKKKKGADGVLDDEAATAGNVVIEDVDESEEVASPAEQLRQKQSAAQDSVSRLRRAARTVLIWGLPSAAPAFVEKFTKSMAVCGKIENIIIPAAVPLTVQEHLSICAEVVFEQKSSTKTAVRKFDKQQWNIKAGKGKSKSAAKSTGISFVRLHASIASTAKARRNCRLIIRNLTFKATRQDVINAFASFGPIAQVHMPDAAETLDQRKKGGKQAKHRGFAFVQFLFKQDAARALKAVNMSNVKGRPVAVDWVASAKVDEGAAKPSLTEMSEMQLSADDDAKPSAEKDEQSDGEEEETSLHGESDDDDEQSDDVESDEGSGDDVDDDGEQRARLKTPLSDVGDAVKGTTLFLCNLALSTSRRQLSSIFKDFGSIKSIYLVRDRVSGAFRGSAFVQFRDVKSADKALERYAYEQPKGQYSHKYRDSSNASSKVDAQSSDIEPKLVLDGRAIIVRRAVDRATSDRLAAAGEKRRKDKRNMYLLEEGHIAVGSTAAEGLTERELEKRQASMRERRQRLHKSPVFFVSPTRLAIQNMNTTGDVHLQQKLKKIFVQATRDAFKHQLVTPEDGPTVASLLEKANIFVKKTQSKLPKRQRQRLAKLDGQKRHEADQELLNKYYDNMKVVLRQVSVVRDQSRLDAKGQPRCRGFAFIEFEDHPHALGALRMVNNNPAFSGMAQRGERLHVQFALENHKVLKDRQRQKELQKEREGNPLMHGHTIESAHLSSRDGLDLFAADAKASSSTASGSAGARRDVSGLTKKQRRKQRRIEKRKIAKEAKKLQRKTGDTTVESEEASEVPQSKKPKKSSKKAQSAKPKSTAVPSPAAKQSGKEADVVLEPSASVASAEPNNRSRRKRARKEAASAASEEAQLRKAFEVQNGVVAADTKQVDKSPTKKAKKKRRSKKDAAETATPQEADGEAKGAADKAELRRQIREKMEAKKAQRGRKLNTGSTSKSAGIVLVSKAKSLESRWFD